MGGNDGGWEARPESSPMQGFYMLRRRHAGHDHPGTFYRDGIRKKTWICLFDAHWMVPIFPMGID
jgi:hypothetical protein